MYLNKFKLLFILFIFTKSVYSWDTEQLEVFDVVEEVKENFYNLLNVSKDATIKEIKTAFRSLSLKLHPDKNLDRDTSVEFRNLVSVFEVLRNDIKRKYYDEVLINGLPNWRSAVYYYRYVRKMGLAEVCFILFCILTIGQYLVNWAAYFEKKYTIEQIKKTKRKKLELDIIIPKPSVFDTLPIQIPKLIWYSIISIPSTFTSLKSTINEINNPIIEEEIIQPIPKIKLPRKRNKFIPPEGPNFEPTITLSNNNNNINEQLPQISSGGLWTDDDLTELVRLVKKYPGGTTGRWELIADTMGRSISEVTYMANKMKDNCYKLPNEDEDEEILPVKIKVKTKKIINDDSEEQLKKWSQIQQKALEEALSKYPKGTSDRWDKIADHVPYKTKDECIARFRYLAEVLKKQRVSN